MLNKWRVSRHQAVTAPANTEMWNYNAKGEVVTANSSNNAFDRSYQFDGIGNRKKSADSITLPVTDNYSANTLNQLTTVNGGARLHDADGNITDNGTHLYEWDAENRLIEIKLKSDNSTVATYTYDYQSRRITKTVGSTETNFVYDGWNPIAEFSGTTLDKTYTWGMDLSGSMQGAGGVGGLLSVNDGNDTFYPTFDGNGNISEYVNATGVVVAHYEYDAFGQVMASGSKKDEFTHQFSTKQLDSESDLHYYGYRFYDSTIGSWINRDPIQERGGVNLYGFVGNNGINFWDRLGLDPVGEWIYGEFLHNVAYGNKTPAPDKRDDGVMNTMAKRTKAAMDTYYKSKVRELIDKGEVDTTWKTFTLPNEVTKNKWYVIKRGDGIQTSDAGFWLNQAHSVKCLGGSIQVRCINGGYEIKNKKGKFEWHDRIDTNPSIHDGIVQSSIEFLWGAVEWYANTAFDVEIKFEDNRPDVEQL